MRPISEMDVVQVDITPSCHLACANCTRFVGHGHSYTMSEDALRAAIESLDGFTGQIGLMGGEPLLHPRFKAMLEIYCEMVPIGKRAIWTSGWKWTEHAAALAEAFLPDRIHFNDHTQADGKHHPLGVAVSEVVADEALMWELIAACPYQLHWSAAITEHGAYFCEIGAASDRVLHNGKHAWKVEPGWWKKTPDQFVDQIKALCVNCSGCLPMPSYSDGRGGRDGPTVDVVSPKMYQRLLEAGSPKARKGHVEIWDRQITRDDLDQIKDWSPRSFRSFEAHSPEDVAKHVESA